MLDLIISGISADSEPRSLSAGVCIYLPVFHPLTEYPAYSVSDKWIRSCDPSALEPKGEMETT